MYSLQFINDKLLNCTLMTYTWYPILILHTWYIIWIPIILHLITLPLLLYSNRSILPVKQGHNKRYLMSIFNEILQHVKGCSNNTNLSKIELQLLQKRTRWCGYSILFSLYLTSYSLNISNKMVWLFHIIFLIFDCVFAQYL